MKKIVGSILCLAALLACLSVGVYAAAPSLTVKCGSKHEAGETFTVDIVAGSIPDCCDISFHLTYDPEQVEIVSIKAGKAFSGGIFDSNPTYSEGTAEISFASTTPQTVDGVLATVEFTAKNFANGKTSFQLAQVQAHDIESDLITLTSKNAQVSILPMPDAVLSVIPAAGSNGTVVLNLNLSNAAKYCGLSFRLAYDSSRYSVVSVEQGPAVQEAGLSGLLFTKNPEISDHEIFASFASATPISLGGHILTVTLQPIKGAADANEFTINKLKLYDSDGAALPAVWSFEPGTLTDLSLTGDSFVASANLVNLASTSQEYTVVFALYAENGKMLEVVTQKKTVAAGAAAQFKLELEENSSGAYVQVFFLDAFNLPVASSARQTLGNN